MNPAARDSSTLPLISVLVPCYNERECLLEFHRRLSAVAKSLPYRFEIIFVDDGSTDDTWAKIRDLAGEDPRVRGLRFSRNFGHQAALRAGYDAAAGVAVICMDADLQHPPESIPEMIAAWQAGYDVVNTVRRDFRGAPVVKRLTAALFYRIFAWCSGMPLRPNIADFRLLDRRVVRQMRLFQERNFSFRFVVQWMGFRQTHVEYQCGQRFGGVSKYGLPRMVRFGMRSLMQFSTFPLRLAFVFSLIGSLACVAYAVYALYVRFVLRSAVPGWTSLVLVVSFFASMQFLTIGLLGEYLAVVYDEVKRRPRYLLSETVGGEGGDTGGDVKHEP